MEKRDEYVGITVVIGCLLYMVTYGSIKKDLLKENQSTTFGVITRFYISGKPSSTSVEYEFSVHGVKYTNSKGVDFPVGELIFRSFPVIYCNSDIENNTMLITEEDFEKYNRTFPDSLNWIKKYRESR